MSTISVIIPFHNNKETIRRCLDSITTQTYGDFDVICVDDASDDDTASIIRSEYPEVTILTNETVQGPLRSRLRGVEHSDAEYILFVDADDYIDPDFVEKIIVQSDLNTVVMGSVKNENEDGAVISVNDSPFTMHGEEVMEGFFSQAGSDLRWFTLWGNLIPRLIIVDDARQLDSFANIPIGEDILSMTLILRKVKSVISSQDTFYHYVKNKNGLTHKSMSYDEISKALEGLKKVFFYLKKIGNNSKSQRFGYNVWKDSYLKIWSKKIRIMEKNPLKKCLLLVKLRSALK